MTDGLEYVTGWVHRKGWGIAHVLCPESGLTWLGVWYVTTMCGRTVQANAIEIADCGDRCTVCARRSTAEENEVDDTVSRRVGS